MPMIGPPPEGYRNDIPVKEEIDDSDTPLYRGGLARQEGFVSLDTPSPRAYVLDTAKSLVLGERNNQYGPPTQDFDRTAGVLNALGYRKGSGQPLDSHDVALILTSVKLSRLMWNPRKVDSWVDLAGYAACGYECAGSDPGNDPPQ